MIDAHAENAKVLAAVLGIDEEVATKLLDVHIAITTEGDNAANAIAIHVRRLLDRTVRSPSGDPAVEIVIGKAKPRWSCPVVWVGGQQEVVYVGVNGTRGSIPSAVAGPTTIVVACYAAAAAVRVALGEVFRLSYTDPVVIDPTLFVAPTIPIQIGRVHLAGAGAIGNAFLYGLAGLQVSGEIHVVDPKLVAPGNLSRCLWFEDADLKTNKAVALVSRATSSLSQVRLVAHATALDRVGHRTDGAWLERLVVGVDSRRARRRLQEELPREVYDASTTGIEEVVLHVNERLAPACLACAYPEDAQEHAHEQHVAEMLGVALHDVRRNLIDETAAALVAARHVHLDAASLVGRAYDSIFKAVCGTGQIGTEEGRTVLAPLAFVSVLAGAVLAIEFLRRVAAGNVAGPFTGWRLSPWASPVPELRRTAERRPGCPCCGQAVFRETVDELWAPSPTSPNGSIGSYNPG